MHAQSFIVMFRTTQQSSSVYKASESVSPLNTFQLALEDGIQILRDVLAPVGDKIDNSVWEEFLEENAIVDGVMSASLYPGEKCMEVIFETEEQRAAALEDPSSILKEECMPLFVLHIHTSPIVTEFINDTLYIMNSMDGTIYASVNSIDEVSDAATEFSRVLAIVGGASGGTLEDIFPEKTVKAV